MQQCGANQKNPSISVTQYWRAKANDMASDKRPVRWTGGSAIEERYLVHVVYRRENKQKSTKSE